jgi:hypothetical protein
MYKDNITYKLNFSFDFFGDITKNKESVSSFKEGELFYHNSEFGRFYSVADGAQISDGVAAKVGRQMKKKMFVKAEVQMF